MDSALPPPPDAPLAQKVAHAWRTTETKWYPLPLAVGALLLVGLAWKHEYQRRRREAEVTLSGDGEVLKLQGPWQVHVLGALPLRQLSRLWGWLNSHELPLWLRPYGYGFYAWLFGVNLEEMDPADLSAYRSLGEFFYRGLKDGARPIAGTELVSPSDGTVVHLGEIQANRRIEQIKGVTYSLDALLGRGQSSTPVLSPSLPPREGTQDSAFAEINGIPYSLISLMGSPSSKPPNAPHRPATPIKAQDQGDRAIHQPVGEKVHHSVQVAQEMGAQAVTSLGHTVREGNSLFYIVVYLGPGDYHRFHSPASWVVEKRRHFSGELFSVNPWLVSRLPNLFVLNERVALLGKWRHGFFSFIPVGATNVGSINISFDTDLRTNAHSAPPVGTFVEASYSSASALLGGWPAVKGEEMGGFALGSTIVLVFEAPQRWEWSVKPGEKVRVGQALGDHAH
ncbi:phosphatidylserine decarboxylase [Dacryopinax primogenitus]|uniref:Phosphatidylserine decarboxylase proenzyme 1, mitochondrial n=1 Tax=Dacryopinax primogenitus (strain DJM 731) TaxID=1858805 RepID=M5FSL0_DACPD|nr:phosphatidylserine decarboxylase [Dacryopinax primogenitus]EJT98898.1 phosphatidylserine decarboxylase [Dacryopinax primogenitus]